MANLAGFSAREVWALLEFELVCEKQSAFEAADDAMLIADDGRPNGSGETERSAGEEQSSDEGC